MNSAENFPDETAKLHEKACKEEKDYYFDPVTNFMVMTEYYLLKRGWCCAKGCRHCPYRSQPCQN